MTEFPSRNELFRHVNNGCSTDHHRLPDIPKTDEPRFVFSVDQVMEEKPPSGRAFSRHGWLYPYQALGPPE